MTRAQVLSIMFLGVLIGAILTNSRPMDAVAQEQPATQPERRAAAHAGEVDVERCRQLMRRRTELQEEMAEADEGLRELQRALLLAEPQEQKVDVMAELLDRLVQQRLDMRERMMAMHECMLAHMMRHVTAAMPGGADGAAAASAMGCPVLEGALDDDAAASP